MYLFIDYFVSFHFFYFTRAKNRSSHTILYDPPSPPLLICTRYLRLLHFYPTRVLAPNPLKPTHPATI